MIKTVSGITFDEDIVNQSLEVISEAGPYRIVGKRLDEVFSYEKAQEAVLKDDWQTIFKAFSNNRITERFLIYILLKSNVDFMPFVGELIGRGGYIQFFNMKGITEIVLPETIKGLNINSFDSLYQLEKLTIPSSVTAIHTEAITDCPNLKEIIYEGTIEEFRTLIAKSNPNCPNPFPRFEAFCSDAKVICKDGMVEG